jgi:hypothetical protein
VARCGPGEAEHALERSVPDGEPFWIAFFTPRQLAAESMYAAASLGNVRQTRRRALRVLSGSDGMRRRQVLATATLAASYLPSSGAQRDPTRISEWHVTSCAKRSR